MPLDNSGQPATQPAASSAAPPSSGSPSPSSASKIVFEHEMGTGPDLLADSPAESQVPSTDRPPAEGGERSGDEGKPSTEAGKPQGDKPAGEPDPLDAALEYYTGEQKPADEVKSEAKPETELDSSDAFKAIEGRLPEVTAKLKELGLDDKTVDQIINANKLVGRQSTELGEARKTKAQFTEAMKQLSPVLEADETGNIKGFNGIRLLEMATQKYGPAEVQKQLEAVGLRLVNAAEYARQTTTAGKDAGAAAREQIIRQVAKEYGIEGEDLSLAEIRSLIDDDLNAKDALTERIAEARQQQGRVAEFEASKRKEAEQQEIAQAQQTYAELKGKIPHFAELEPVMQQMFTETFSKGMPSKAQLLQFLAQAAEGKTIGQRLPKILDLHKQTVERALMKRLGIPDSELSRLTAPATIKPANPPKEDEFEEAFRAVGPALV